MQEVLAHTVAVVVKESFIEEAALGLWGSKGLMVVVLFGEENLITGGGNYLSSGAGLSFMAFIAEGYVSLENIDSNSRSVGAVLTKRRRWVVYK